MKYHSERAQGMEALFVLLLVVFVVMILMSVIGFSMHHIINHITAALNSKS